MNENQYYPYPPQQHRQNYTPYYQMQQMQMQNYIKCRPVLSIEEARAAQIDMDGTPAVFTDFGNKRIYTKQINQDGTASFRVYGLLEDANAGAPPYVTRDEFKNVLNQINDAFSKLNAQRPQSIQPESAPAQKREFNI